MSNYFRITLILVLILLVGGAAEDQQTSSRGGYQYRENADFVLKRLGLKSGNVVVDIGAGDGWWAERMAKSIGADGVIYAGEVEQKKVDKMQERFANTSQVKPYLCPTDGTGLDENSCDLAFLSKTYHHLNKDSHVSYLRHLKNVVKANGRLCVIERHPALAEGRGKEHGWLPGLLIQQAEQAGWVLLRCEFVKKSDHFMATFVQPEFLANKIFKKKPRPQKDLATSRDN